MARYIDVDVLLEMLNNKAETDYEMGLYNHGALTQSFIRFVERQPTADVVEVKRGEWLNIAFTQRYRCSLCGNEIYFGKDKFCSECGARMDGTPKESGGEK